MSQSSQIIPGIQALNDIRFAENFSGSDAGVKIEAAIADLPASGGVVDARGFESTQTIAATIDITKPCVLLLGVGKFTTTVDPLIQVSANNVALVGLGYELSELENSTAAANIVLVDASTSGFSATGILFDAGGKTIDDPNRAQGNGIYFNGGSGTEIVDAQVFNNKFVDGHSAIYGNFVQDSSFFGNIVDTTHEATTHFLFSNVANITIDDNRFISISSITNGLPTAISVIPAGVVDGFSTGVIVSNNVFHSTDATAESINFSNVQNSSITDNIIRIVNPKAFAVGIRLGGQATSQNPTIARNFNNVVTGNVISMTGTGGGSGVYGVLVVNSDDNVGLEAFNLNISNNDIEIDVPTYVAGMRLVTARDSVVIGNRVALRNPPASVHGIHLVRNATATIAKTATVLAGAGLGASRSGSIVTLTTTAAHGFLPGQRVDITSVDDGTYNLSDVFIMQVPSTTTLTFVDPTTSGGAASQNGTITNGEDHPTNILLAGNSVSGASSNGINVEYGDGITAVGNHLLNNQSGINLGISTKNSYVGGNAFVQNNVRGLNVTSDSGAGNSIGQNFYAGNPATVNYATAPGGSLIGFYDAVPVAQQTGVAVSAAGIHAALVNLGLITA